MRRIAAWIVVSGVLLTGCADTKPTDLMTTTLNAYQHALRWDGIATAALFVDPAVREKHPITAQDQQRYAQVTINDYDDGQGPIPIDATHVQQIVQLGVVNNRTQAEHTVVDHQLWRYDAATRHWWLESGLPNITQD